jgi:Lrp/AsnC family transcriptional regulator for asnA, asnC and gidA
MKDAMMPYTGIADKIYVSGGTVHVRMKKLMDKGVVKGTALVIDPSKLGYELTAFVGVYLQKGSAYDKVIKKLEKVPEVVEAHYTTGVYSIFIKMICRNTRHLREILNDEIQTIEGVERTDTIVSLEESIHRSIDILGTR